MVQAKNSVKMGDGYKTFLAIFMVLSLAMSLGSLLMVSNLKDEKVDLSGITDKLDSMELKLSGTEATNVEVDTSEIDAKITNLENTLDDLMDKAYSDEKSELENDSLIAFDKEFNTSESEDLEDLEDALEDLIVDFDELDGEVVLDEDFGDDGVKYTIVNLGLDDDEDKEILVSKLYKIRYELEDSTKSYKEDVLVIGNYYYDDDDEEFVVDFTYELA